MIEDWPGAEQFTNYLRPSLTQKQLRTLREFYMVQQALAVELREAKSLGICKTTTLIKTDPTMTRLSVEDSKEMLSSMTSHLRRKVD